MGINKTQAIFQNMIFFFGQLIGGQPAFALANTHRPARSGKADADILRRFY